jgi:hypothetical protein
LAQAIQRLVSDEALRNRMGRAGLARFSECFTMAHYIDRAEEKIRQFVPGKGGAVHTGADFHRDRLTSCMGSCGKVKRDNT